MFRPVREQLEVIRNRVVEIIPSEELERKLTQSFKNNKPLIVKLGCDPSRPDLHIGHSVVLQKLRDFQDLGHKVVLIVGDFTGMIGDPSGKNKTRPSLTLEETKINGKTYVEQATKILSTENLEIRYNSEWLDAMKFSDVIRLASHYTVARILERDDFEKRFKNDEPISLHELLYPLSQAMDCVETRSDIEVGGTDQKFNFLVGRDIQQAYGQEPQVIITCELLEGTDGSEKMSKSLNNSINFTDSPKDIFGKTMSIPDSLIYKYFRLCTDLGQKDLSEMKKELDTKETNPRDLKRKLAFELVKKYYNNEIAERAQDEFDRIFVKKDLPENIESVSVPITKAMNLINLLTNAGLSDSNANSKRLVEQGAVSINKEKMTDWNLSMSQYIGKELIIKVGKRKFLKVKIIE